MSQRCSAKNRTGKQCGAWAASGEDKCSLHLHPGLAAKMGASHGSRLASPPQSDAPMMQPPKTARELMDLLANTMVQVHAGQINAKTANALAYVAMSLLRAIEASEIEMRLQSLESNQLLEERAALWSIPKESKNGGGS
jgi:hypothetical protein